MIANNLLYENTQINHYLFKTWEDKFIPFGIIDSIIYCNANQFKRENYAINFNDGNFENDFDAAIVGIDIERDHINSSYIYSDINN